MKTALKPGNPITRNTQEIYLTYYYSVDHWETIGIAGLSAGYRNVFQRGDGTYRLASRTERHNLPYETRTVFADSDGNDIEPACEISNYIRTLLPGEEYSA